MMQTLPQMPSLILWGLISQSGGGCPPHLGCPHAHQPLEQLCHREGMKYLTSTPRMWIMMVSGWFMPLHRMGSMCTARVCPTLATLGTTWSCLTMDGFCKSLAKRQCHVKMYSLLSPKVPHHYLLELQLSPPFYPVWRLFQVGGLFVGFAGNVILS